MEKQTESFDLTKLTRKEKLRIYMLINRMTFASIAQQINLTEGAVRYLLLNETVPTKRHRELVTIGIPEEFIPKAEDKKSGPKRKNVLSSF